MVFLYFFAAVMVLFLVWRVLSPGDARLNLVYLRQFLKNDQGQGPSKVRITRIPVMLPAGQPEEKVYYHVGASFPNGSSRDITALVFYPLEALHVEREKHKKPLETDDLNPMSQLSTSPNMMTNSELDKLKEDPLKEHLEEQKFADQKLFRLRAEIDQLSLINKHSDFFPKLIVHDDRRNITLLEAVGNIRLDDLLQGLSLEARVEVLGRFIERMSDFHSAGLPLAQQLLPGISHTEELIRSQINGAFEGFVLAGVELTDLEIMEILDAARALIDVSADEGPKLVDASPRAFFCHNEEVRPLDFGRVRKDISAIDVVELLCDPSTGISPEMELRLYARYAKHHCSEPTEQQALLQTLCRLSIYYRLVLAGYLVKHFIALQKAKPEQRAALKIKYWSVESLPQAIQKLKFFLERDPELERLLQMLNPKLDELAKYKG